MNRLVKINYPDSTAATFVYDALGREILRSGTAETVEKAYDVAGNLISEKFVNQNKGWSYSFDLMGDISPHHSPPKIFMSQETGQRAFSAHSRLCRLLQLSNNPLKTTKPRTTTAKTTQTSSQNHKIEK